MTHNADETRSRTSERLRSLTEEYLELYQDLAGAIGHADGGEASQFVRDQVLASARLRARLERLVGANEHVDIELVLRRRQVEREEQRLEQQRVQLAGCEALLEERRRWAYEAAGPRALLPRELDAAASAAHLERTSTASARLAQQLLNAHEARDSVVARLRDALQRLLQAQQAERQRATAAEDADPREVRLNLERLGLVEKPADLAEVFGTLRAKLVALDAETRVEGARVVRAEDQLVTAEAEVRALAAGSEWLAGELAAQQTWLMLGLETASNSETDDAAEVAELADEQRAVQLTGLTRLLRQRDEETWVAQSEMLARSAELRWLKGTLQAMRSWAQVVERLAEAEVAS
jgi:hypothetical protein